MDGLRIFIEYSSFSLSYSILHDVRFSDVTHMKKRLTMLLIQLLHGLSFSTMWVAGVSYANDIAPKGMGATAQGLFSGVQLGLAGTFGGLIGGFLYENLGAVMMFRWVGMIGFVALILFLMVEMVSNKLPHTFKVSR